MLGAGPGGGPGARGGRPGAGGASLGGGTGSGAARCGSRRARPGAAPLRGCTGRGGERRVLELPGERGVRAAALRGRCRARRGTGERESSGAAENRGTLTPGSRAEGPGAGPTARPTRRAGVGAGTGKTGLPAACLLLCAVPGWANW